MNSEPHDECVLLEICSVMEMFNFPRASHGSLQN